MKDIHLENSLKLSLISISKENEKNFVFKFEKIIKMLNEISDIESKSDFELEKLDINSLTEDKVLPSLSLESIKKLSNSFLDGYFLSPKILE